MKTMRMACAVPLVLFMALAMAGDRSPPLLDRAAPDFVLPRLDEPALSVARDDLRGRVWVLNVWASWCAGCRDEQPALMKLAVDERVALVGLNYKDARPDALRWLERHGNPYVFTLHDPAGRTAQDFGVHGVPETYVIDRDGRVRMKLTGALTRPLIERVLRPLLERL